MKQILYIFLCFMLPATVFSQKADDILNKSIAAYENTKGMRVSFHLQSQSEKLQVSEDMEGTIEMIGEKFVLKTSNINIWFDGKNLWTYSSDIDEVNISEPTGEELREINPILLLTTYQKDFKASLKGENASAGGKSNYNIELTPKSKKDINKVELHIEKQTYLPSYIAISFKNELQMKIQINRMETGVNYSSDYFVFKKSDFPNVEIIDLR